MFLFLLLCAGADAQTKQDEFIFRVDNFPARHDWNYATDPNETGHLTYSSGSEYFLLSDSHDDLFLDSLVEVSGDTIEYRSHWSLDPIKHLTVVFDPAPKRIRSLEYYVDSNVYGETNQTYYIHIENVDVVETPFTFECTLKGNDILAHNFLDSNRHYLFTQSGGQSWEDIGKTRDTVLSSSEVYFSLPKPHLLSVSRGNDLARGQLLLYPQPARNRLYVISSIELRPSSIIISDMLGRPVPTISIKGDIKDLEIDITSLSPGIYWLRAGGEMLKFVVAR
jgi:hypothetical protein